MLKPWAPLFVAAGILFFLVAPSGNPRVPFDADACLTGVTAAVSSADPTQKTFKHLLEVADQEQRDGCLEDAIAKYKSITAANKSLVSDDERKAATIREVLAEAKAQSPHYWLLRNRFLYLHPIALATVLSVVCLLVGWGLSRLRPIKATLTNFQELSPSKDPAAPAGVTTGFLLDLLEKPALAQTAGLHMDMMPGADEPGFGGLRLTAYSESNGKYVPSDHPVKIGAFEFTPGDVVRALGRFFQRPYESQLSGWIQQMGDEAIAVAELKYSFGESAGVSRIWSARAAGNKARQTALKDLAAQIIVGTGEPTITNNWQSYRDFAEGMRLLHLDTEAVPDPTGTVCARTCFENAICQDSANWIARFQFALVLCKEDQPEQALQHLKILEDTLKAAVNQQDSVQKGKKKSGTFRWFKNSRDEQEPKDSCHQNKLAFEEVVRHVGRHPVCPFLVLYNKAIALSALPSRKTSEEAAELLSRLANHPEECEGFEKWAAKIGSRVKAELRLYSLATLSTIRASMYVSAVNENRLGDAQRYRSEVEEALKEIQTLCLEMQSQHWRSLQTARGVALSSMARVLLAPEDGQLLAEPCQAEELLLRALAAEPNLVDGHIQLAELHIRYKQKLSDHWWKSTELWLARAEELNARCEQATVLRAILYAEPRAGRLREAFDILADCDGLDARVVYAKLAWRNEVGTAKLIDLFNGVCLKIRLSVGFGPPAVEMLDRKLFGSRAKLVTCDERFELVVLSFKSLLQNDNSVEGDAAGIRNLLLDRYESVPQSAVA